ncbi:MAG: vanillate monooxygenase [Novosphingobium sp. SCN 66-18]|nr:MAG: vanillate monooxygenase [Novosphingobium sp. SCN 66-18]
MTDYLMNAWYQAGFTEEVPAGGKLGRIICEIPLVFFRRPGGQLTALVDRCAHRFAPLSAGRVDGGAIFCGYHGLGFGAEGTCVHNPHGPIVSALRLRSFPVVERHAIIWVWLGDPDRAEPALIPDLSYIDETPPQARIAGYMPTAANYQLLSDNILDLSHADYLHPDTLGGINTTAKSTNRREGDTIVVDWLAENCEPPPAFRVTLNGAQRADIWTEVVWQAPAVLTLGVAAVPAGQPRTAQDESYTLHNMVPETATTTHYFYCSTRRFRVDDEGFSQFLRGAFAQAFTQEDKPMLEKQQARIGTADFWSLEPVLLKIDAASTRARRLLGQRIADEKTESR